MPWNRCRRFFGFVALFSLVGCSGADQPIRQKGIVTLEGQPLAGVTVTFMSTENKRPASATTDEGGRFELMTYSPGDGVLRGEYKVVLTSTTSAPQRQIPGAPQFAGVNETGKKVAPPLHPNYNSPDKTPLRRVVPAPEGEILLELNKDGS